MALCACLGHGLAAQTYLGHATKQVNLRQGPGTGYKVLRGIPAGSNLFIISTETVDGFYPVVHIDSDTEGYVHHSYVALDERLAPNQDGVFTPTGRTAGQLCELEIYNRTEKVLTLKLDSETHTFQPHQRTKLAVAPRTYSYRASAPGVLPDFGTERLEAGTAYSWEFYIITQRR